ncbi:ribosome maturation protein RimP [Wenjunlia vitaminophila]|uniref:Ribosome maturation factor RimP n=1 Tax=Wenjunlia vitaminophila TaxID=76728 RepID=A0A0T6LY37_WENVI|nr:ribosome maturation factor RimP [Wenjunlia vitaminophila]KRV51035.1 ribosome maturation protein RimP [Wenjunlia vitaminophila]
MRTTQTDRLRELLDPLVAGAGAELEEVSVTTVGKRRQLLVVVDADGGVSLDLIAELTREFSRVLDESDAMGSAPYLLEVSSPGVDRPLSEPRHFRRALGRMVRIKLVDGQELTARITGIDDTGLDLQVPGVKGRRPTARRVPLEQVAGARVEVEFSRPTSEPSASGPEAGGSGSGGQDAEPTAAADHDDDMNAPHQDEEKEEA